MTTTNSPKTAQLFPVYLASFLDFLGIAIIIPVLSPLIVDNNSGLVPPIYDLHDREVIFGLLIATYPFFQFIGAPILGALSDRYGRKRLLLLSLTGSMVGYLLFGYAILTNDLWLAFGSRILDGFTGGSISIVYSAVADLSCQEKKAQNFGLIGMMGGFGFVIGPFLGGVLANEKLVSWFDPAVPFWVSAGLFAVNLLLIVLLFRETLSAPNPSPINPLSGFQNLGAALKMKSLRGLFTIVFLTATGFAFFTQFFQVYLVNRFGFEEMDIGLLYGYVGVCIALVQGGLVRLVIKWFERGPILRVLLLLLSVTLAAVVIPGEVWMIYAIIPFIALSRGISKTVLDAMVSDEASPSEQGKVLGINQSIASIGLTVPPIISGFLTAFDSALPTFTGAGLVFLAWFAFLLIRR